MNHKITKGDCIASLGEKFGLPWEKIWNHSNNSALKDQRKNPNVLHEGDVVFIPDKTIKEEDCAAEQKHKFLTKIKKVWLRVRLLEEDKPRKNLSYTLEVDGQSIVGSTDGNGKLEEEIPAKAKEARIRTEEDICLIKLGHLDPVQENSGVEQRLQNLSFLGKDVNADSLLAAITAFQKKHSLNETGTADEATRNKLLEKHGS